MWEAKALATNEEDFQIYVQLLDEGTVVYRPVPARKISSSICVLEGADLYDPDNEVWEFLPGTQVIVEEKEFSDGTHPVAVKLAKG